MSEQTESAEMTEQFRTMLNDMTDEEKQSVFEFLWYLHCIRENEEEAFT